MGGFVSTIWADAITAGAEATTTAHASSPAGLILSSPFSCASSHSLSSRSHWPYLLILFFTPFLLDLGEEGQELVCCFAVFLLIFF
jgi:hypothetical protein